MRGDEAMEVHLTVKEASALLYELADDTKPSVTISELRTAMKVLSFLLVQPDAVVHAATLPDAIGKADEYLLVYETVSRFAGVFCESGMAYMSLNLATSQNDPWTVS
jgi:hypothetical protein